MDRKFSTENRRYAQAVQFAFQVVGCYLLQSRNGQLLDGKFEHQLAK